MESSNAARAAYGQPDFLMWFILLSGMWLICKIVKDLNDSDFGDM